MRKREIQSGFIQMGSKLTDQSGSVLATTQETPPSPTGSNDIYISQSGSGSQDGSTCSNANPVSFFNTTLFSNIQ